MTGTRLALVWKDCAKTIAVCRPSGFGLEPFPDERRLFSLHLPRARYDTGSPFKSPIPSTGESIWSNREQHISDAFCFVLA